MDADGMSHGRFRAVLATATLLLLAAPAAAKADAFPLVGWWPMNEGSGQVIRDWSGHGNNGYLGSTPQVDDNDPGWIGGVFSGSALRFFGDDFATIPASSSLQPQRLTVDAWVRFDADAMGGEAGIFKYPISMGGNGCDLSSYGMVTDVNQGLAFYIGSNGNYIVSPSAPSSMWDGNWHNVGGTFDGRTLRMYLDGVQMGNGTPVPAGTTIDYSLATTSGAIGGYAGQCDSRLLNLRGDVDGVQIWSTSLPIDTIWRFLKAVLTNSR
jgi:hypothetical protein